MRSAAALLTLLVATTQTVSFTDCLCKFDCRNKGACTSCEPQAPPKREAPESHSCCEKGKKTEEQRPAPKRCVHLEPSHEVTSVASALPEVAPAAIAILLPILPDLHEVSLQSTLAAFVPRPARSRPIHLLDSVFLI